MGGLIRQMQKTQSLGNPGCATRYFSLTSPTTSPPLPSTACTHTLLNASLSSGYCVTMALARLRASGCLALKSQVPGTEHLTEGSTFFSALYVARSAMVDLLPLAE